MHAFKVMQFGANSQLCLDFIVMENLVISLVPNSNVILIYEKQL